MQEDGERMMIIKTGEEIKKSQYNNSTEYVEIDSLKNRILELGFYGKSFQDLMKELGETE